MKVSMEDAIGIYGILKSVNKRTDDFCIPLYHSEVITLNSQTTYCSGVDNDQHLARLKAIAEGLERYANMTYLLRDMLYGTSRHIAEKTGTCVEIQDLDLYSEEQYQEEKFPHVRPELDLALWWCSVENLHTGAVTYYPSEFVYLDFPYKLHYPLSTGTACHSVLEKAMVSAVLEVVERDAMMLMWKRRMEVPAIRKSTIHDSDIRHILNQFENKDYLVDVFDITMEHGIPSVFVMARGGYGLPSLSVAVASSITLIDAIKKSLYELTLIVTGNVRSLLYSDENAGRKLDFLESHSAAYIKHKDLREIEFLFKGSEMDFDTLNEKKICIDPNRSVLEQLKKILERNGFDLYGKNITPRDVSQLGFYVYKALIPQMLPLDIEKPFDGKKRLYEIQDIVDWKCSDEINHDIQPFS